MLVRIALVTAVVAALLVAVAEGTLLQRAGLAGSCEKVAAPNGEDGEWRACRSGRLQGRPDLTQESCQSTGIVDGLEYWSCPAPLSYGRAGVHP